jgi:hypothetical protein
VLFQASIIAYARCKLRIASKADLNADLFLSQGLDESRCVDTFVYSAAFNND